MVDGTSIFCIRVSHPGAPTKSVYETPAEMYNNNNCKALRRQLLPRSSERKRFTISEGSSVSTTRGSKVEVAWIGSFIGSFM